jgi:hypothetical protein
MTDQEIRDIVCILIIGVCLTISALGHEIPPVVLGWAQICFGFLFGSKTANYTIGRSNVTKEQTVTTGADTTKIVQTTAAIFVFLMLSVGTARADIFNPLPNVDKPALSQPVVNLDSGTLLGDLTSVINYLGVQEGEVYNFNAKKWETITGATLITYSPWGLDAGVAMLNTDGIAGTIDWNVGQFLPVANIPVMKYFSYLYLSGGAGGEENSSSAWKLATFVGAKFKLTF